MGFYLKKGFNFGPLRVNFSKSGLGFSFGVKGLRIGSGPNGNYLHAGRKGIYYKKSLPSLFDGENFLHIGWLGLIVVGVIAGAVYFYFYFYFDGDFQSMQEAFLTQMKL